jgi:hypothetical protein
MHFSFLVFSGMLTSGNRTAQNRSLPLGVRMLFMLSCFTNISLGGIFRPDRLHKTVSAPRSLTRVEFGSSTIIAALIKDFGLSGEDAALALDRACGGVVSDLPIASFVAHASRSSHRLTPSSFACSALSVLLNAWQSEVKLDSRAAGFLRNSHPRNAPVQPQESKHGQGPDAPGLRTSLRPLIKMPGLDAGANDNSRSASHCHRDIHHRAGEPVQRRA